MSAASSGVRLMHRKWNLDTGGSAGERAESLGARTHQLLQFSHWIIGCSPVSKPRQMQSTCTLSVRPRVRKEGEGDSHNVRSGSLSSSSSSSSCSSMMASASSSSTALPLPFLLRAGVPLLLDEDDLFLERMGGAYGVEGRRSCAMSFALLDGARTRPMVVVGGALAWWLEGEEAPSPSSNLGHKKKLDCPSPSTPAALDYAMVVSLASSGGAAKLYCVNGGSSQKNAAAWINSQVKRKGGAGGGGGEGEIRLIQVSDGSWRSPGGATTRAGADGVPISPGL